MEKALLLNIVKYSLFIISIVMIVISIKAKILPPALTGIGFILIALTL